MLPLHDEKTSGKFPLMNIAIILFTFYIFYLELKAPNLDEFFQKWAFIPSNLQFNNWHTYYPLITSTFLHAGFAHIISNMWFLWIFGDNVENDLGSIPYLIFYLIGGIIACLTQMFFAYDPLTPNVGASGAIAAVLGYYIIKFPRHRVLTLMPYFFVLSLPAIIPLAIWFITQIFNGYASITHSTADSGIAFFAHIGGFIFGVIIGFIKPGKKQYLDSI